MADETTPLLNGDASADPHAQFCLLIGIPPSDTAKIHRSSDRTLYNRATRKRRAQVMTYSFTAALTNTLLLSQVVLGATLTALGASESSHVLITIFGVLNTIIAGLVAYLKSRGQPMRARMFRDDLEHVVEEIENSKTMWLGIQNGIHGYDEIDIEDKVSVRGEVARLTRLYESAVNKYMQNNPDMYSTGGGMLDAITGLRARPGLGVQLPPAVAATDAGAVAAAGPAAAIAPAPEDESPATAKDSDKADKSADESPAIAKDDVKVDDKGKDEEGGKDQEEEEAEADAPAGEPSAAKDEGPDATEGADSKGKAEDVDADPPTAATPPKKDDDLDDSAEGANGDAKPST